MREKKFLNLEKMKEKKEKDVIDKAQESIKFLTNITPYYSLCYNDVVLFTRLSNDLKKLNLIKSSKAQNFLYLLSQNLETNNKNRTDNFREHLKRKSEVLENNYKFKNMHYRQTSPYTCSIATYMMAISIFKKDFKPNKKKEKDLYNKLLRPNTKTIQLCDLVEEALKNNLYVKVFSRFDYRDKKFDSDLAETLRLNYLNVIDRCKKNQHFQEYTNIETNPVFLKNHLMNGEPIIINGTTESGELHARLITGYNGEDFIVSDPLFYQKQEYSFEEIQKLSNPPLGGWFFTLSNKEISFYSY